MARYSFDALRRRPGRTALTTIGIGLATALVVILLAVSEGVQSSADRLANESGVDLLATSHTNQSVSLTGYPFISQAHELSGEIPVSDPNVLTASPWLVGDLTYANASLFAAANSSSARDPIPSEWAPTEAGSIGWIPSDNSGIEVPSILNGSGFTVPGDPHYANGSFSGPRTNEIVLDQGLAEILHVVDGSDLWASESGYSGATSLLDWFDNATEFRVVGISGPFWLIPSELLAFLYLSEYQSLIGSTNTSTDYASLVLIHLKDPSQASHDQSLLSSVYPSLTFFTLAEILGAVQNAVNLYRTFGTIIGAIGIIVATLFTTTVLLMSVDDRSREIAVLRALGFPRSTIGRFVVEEGIWLSLLGLALGLPLALLGSTLLNDALLRLVSALPSGFSFVSFDGTVLVSGLLIVLAIGVVAAILPAGRAMQLPVAEELRAP